MSTNPPSTPPIQPQFSGDGRWWWNGKDWISTTPGPASFADDARYPSSPSYPAVDEYLGQRVDTNGFAITSLVLGLIWV